MGKKKTFPYEREQGRLLVPSEPPSSYEIRGHLVGADDEENDAGLIIIASWVGSGDNWNGEEMYRISPRIAAGLREWFKS